jgi:hypothetical protein
VPARRNGSLMSPVNTVAFGGGGEIRFHFNRQQQTLRLRAGTIISLFFAIMAKSIDSIAYLNDINLTVRAF